MGSTLYSNIANKKGKVQFSAEKSLALYSTVCICTIVQYKYSTVKVMYGSMYGRIEPCIQLCTSILLKFNVIVVYVHHI